MLPASRRHQPHLMAIAPDHSGPMMGAAAGLHANQARWQLRKKMFHSRSPKLAPQTWSR
jgi:hypothetical protein